MSLKQVLRSAQIAQRQGDYVAAEVLYLTLLEDDGNREAALTGLTQICLKRKQEQRAIEYLQQLRDRSPHNFSYCEASAGIYVKCHRWSQAAGCYRQFIDNNPGHPDAYYNYAYHLKLAGRYQQAITNYQLALDNQISRPEEVFTNMAVIFSENLRLETNAKENLESALTVAPNYVPALFNLATLLEEEGSKSLAAQRYQRIVDLEPENISALVRLAECLPIDDLGMSIVHNMLNVLNDTTIDYDTRSSVHFALGKVYDQCGEFDQAFQHYKTANQVGRFNSQAYNRASHEHTIDENITFFTHDWFSRRALISDAEPIFICGMFRSGSTLVEQVLAAHPMITAGGERAFFIKLTANLVNPYPISIDELDSRQLHKISQDYLKDLAKAFPNKKRITDKRPDNFLYIGLIKTLFPKARIIQTDRNAIDNSLSVYFLRTAASMSYASDLTDIAHYYKQHLRLMTHWIGLFPDTIHRLNYDTLVADPETVIAEVLNFLNLPWDDNCLNFHRLNNYVKTASVWQVRQPMYQSSSGRWRNYQDDLTELIAEFKD